jgi:AcrR family transcriptional regulator
MSSRACPVGERSEATKGRKLTYAYDRSAILFGMSDGRKTRGDRSRAIVLDKGVVLATTKGLNSFSIGELAEQSGIAKANVSVLFGSKADLQVAITDLARSRFSERVLDPVRLAPAGLGRLLALGECWFDYLSDPKLLGGCFFSAAMFELDAQPGALRDTIGSDMSAWVHAIAAMMPTPLNSVSSVATLIPPMKPLLSSPSASRRTR